MKRTSSLFMTLLAYIVAFSACSPNNSAEESFNLDDFSNPFVGQWQSEIPSANTLLKFDYKADGTFDYEMEGVPADQGGKGTGGYIDSKTYKSHGWISRALLRMPSKLLTTTLSM